MRDHVYRICELAVWAQTRVEGQLLLSELDRRDGYVHLSTAGQVSGTLARYFGGRRDLVLLTIACERLTDGVLRFEGPAYVRDDDQRFPHFYGRVPLSAIVDAEPLMLGPDGQHRLPAALRHTIADEQIAAVDVNVSFDAERGVVLVEYPRAVRIEDEASMLALEAVLERRLDRLGAAHETKLPAVICLDNLWVAPKLERRYAELADKLISRAFSRVARWATRPGTREFFSRANRARGLPCEVFPELSDAVAFVCEVTVGSPSESRPTGEPSPVILAQ